LAVPVTVLLLICGMEMAVGLFAGGPKMLPAVGVEASSPGHPEAGSTPADNYSKLLNCASFHGASAWMREVGDTAGI
jgi:hypothetical protein